MPNFRKERANRFILKELTVLLRESVNDPRITPLTITEVDLTPDRRHARIYVACYSGDDDLREGLCGLESAKGYMRKHLAQVLHWRWTPTIEFRVDESWSYGQRIESLFDALDRERAENEVPDDE